MGITEGISVPAGPKTEHRYTHPTRTRNPDVDKRLLVRPSLTTASAFDPKQDEDPRFLSASNATPMRDILKSLGDPARAGSAERWPDLW
jgi:hypothetical protein